MSSVAIFNMVATPQNLIAYLPSVSEGLYITNPGALKANIIANSDVLINPDISALVNVPQKYWKRSSNSIVEMSSGEKQAVDDAATILSQQSEIVLSGRVATTDATQTNLYTFTIPTGVTYSIEATVIAKRTGGSAGTTGDSLKWTFSGVLNNPSGTVGVVGTPNTNLQRNNSNWAVSTSVAGSTAIIKVTGVANNNISWQLLAKALNISL